MSTNQYGSFDRDFARLLLEICRYTYSSTYPDDDNEKHDAEEALTWINKTEQPKITPLNDGKGIDSTSVACVISYPDKNIVSYMGTKTEFKRLKNANQSLEDWGNNAKFIPTPFVMTKRQLGLGASDEKVELSGEDGLVHEGFFKELCAVHDKVISVLNENGGKARDLYITGHSQGGAEAALATCAFAAGGFNVKATYTFAAPRSGNQVVADSMPKNVAIHRIEFGNDIVPHVPTTHAGHAIVLKCINVLKKIHEELADPLEDFDIKHNLVGIGRLCYGNNDTKIFRVDMSAAQEAKIFDQRLKDLETHPQDLVEHHHLAGTSEDLKPCKDQQDKEQCKGNYTALVSHFYCREG